MKPAELILLSAVAFFNPRVQGGSQNPMILSTTDSVRIEEKAYLHVDRNSYYPGDDIWFKAYLIDASDRRLSSNTTNLHVELISPNLKIIDSRVVRLVNGLGNGDFSLSGKLRSGRYRLRAYTNYMRNFGDQLFFNKDIIIINSSDASKAFSDSLSRKRKNLEINFFPEGGSLVENVTSRVAFKVVNDNGYGQNVSGVIYSSTGEKVSEFKCSHKGMGSFLLNPATGLKYFAVIKSPNGDSLRYDLPESFPTGVVLSISGNENRKLAISFKTNTMTLPSILDHDLFLIVSSGNKPFKTYSLRMKSLNAYLNLTTDDLPDGIILLTLTGVDNIPLCERMAYVNNNEEVKIKVETDKTEYNQRDSVSVKISLISNKSVPQDAFLSLSATDNLFTGPIFPTTISSWFLLESDVRGPIEEPSYYFDPSNSNRLNDLDLLLLTQGWRDFEWKYKNNYYPPEYGFTISGRVRKKFADVPVKDTKINIAIFKGGKPLIKVVPVDSSGKFSLSGLDLTGSAKLIASVTGEKDNLKGWLLLDSTKYSPATITSDLSQTKFKNTGSVFNDIDQNNDGNQNINKSLHTFIQKAEIRKNIQKKYKLSDTITPGEVNIIAIRHDEPESPRARSRRYLMGTPDIELVITPDLHIYNNTYHLIESRYMNPAPFRLGHRMKHPIYMIDGNRVAKSQVEALPLEWVERIDVVDYEVSFAALQTLVDMGGVDSTGKRDFGYADGAISIILKDNKDFPDRPVFHSVNVKFSGYSETRIFYSPKHHTTLESDYKPDLRTTLLWEPNIKVENNKAAYLNYYNADNPSKVEVIVEGITTNGIPVTGKAEYEVK
jgi:hypothetical protein